MKALCHDKGAARSSPTQPFQSRMPCRCLAWTHSCQVMFFPAPLAANPQVSSHCANAVRLPCCHLVLQLALHIFQDVCRIVELDQVQQPGGHTAKPHLQTRSEPELGPPDSTLDFLDCLARSSWSQSSCVCPTVRKLTVTVRNSFNIAQVAHTAMTSLFLACATVLSD